MVLYVSDQTIHIGKEKGLTTLTPHTVKCKDCIFCGATFTTTRADAKTCSTLCRVKMSRWRKRLFKHNHDAIEAIHEMASYLKYTDSTPDAVQLLQHLKAEIEMRLFQANVKAVR